MARIRRFEDLGAWQTARQLTWEVYQLTGSKGFFKDIALRNQMRRTSVAVMTDIAEGFDSGLTSFFMESLGTARGATGAIRSQLIVAFDQGYIDQEDFDGLTVLVAKVGNQITKLLSKLDRRRLIGNNRGRRREDLRQATTSQRSARANNRRQRTSPDADE
jgi:four helix bundle protein